MGQKPKLRLFFLLFVGLFFHLSTPANGYWNNNRGFLGWYFGGGYAGYGGYGGFGAVTPQGDYLRGMGAYMDGMGRLHVSNSVAAEHFQKAYKMYLENRKQAVKNKYELRQLAEDWNTKHKKSPLTKEQLELLAKASLPPRLATGQWDGKAGTFSWPAILNRPEFTDARRTIEKLFQERGERPELAGLNSDNFVQIRDAVDQLAQELSDLIREVDAGQYIASSRFLKTLRYEARFSK